ncbi:hypothetical protein GLE_2116 [Lysobacter enzymogenes]|uniref:Uncharacterized protein n=1 Tax=Lysobacter enzymogenes TaxID=69 RepID=A0A0S2DFY5_LYSEN|nr:hypothetical protein GLE_2116 [Lysobacter enzymogenes]
MREGFRARRLPLRRGAVASSIKKSRQADKRQEQFPNIWV